MNIWLYPFTSPLVLTDNIFNSYGGDINATTEEQRQIAYLLAERRASEDLRTYFQVTTVTGTVAYTPRVVLPHNYVHRIRLIRFIDFEEEVYWTISGTANVYASLWNQERGILDMGWAVANCKCTTHSRPTPYQLEIVYDTGLHSGTVHNSEIPMALQIYSTIILNEVAGFGNESVGDIGVQEFKNQEYYEKRKGLINTAFGNSAQANFANRLLSTFRKLKYVGL